MRKMGQIVINYIEFVQLKVANIGKKHRMGAIYEILVKSILDKKT